EPGIPFFAFSPAVAIFLDSTHQTNFSRFRRTFHWFRLLALLFSLVKLPKRFVSMCARRGAGQLVKSHIELHLAAFAKFEVAVLLFEAARRSKLISYPESVPEQ